MHAVLKYMIMNFKNMCQKICVAKELHCEVQRAGPLRAQHWGGAVPALLLYPEGWCWEDQFHYREVPW